MSDKASQLFQIEFTQNEKGQGGESSIKINRLNFLSLAGSEILNEDPEAIRVKQGPELNKGMLSLNNLLRDLASTPHGDFASYDDSVVTSLSRDIFGGNSLALGIFCLQKGDPIGSSLTMRALQRCLAIQNFPLVNDNRVLGFHRKFRMEIIGAQ